MRIEELRTRRAEILRLAAEHGASNVRVFGSVARGEADVMSDVDFLVDMGSGRSLLDLGGLLEDLRRLLRTTQAPPAACIAARPPTVSKWRIVTSCIHWTKATLLTWPFSSIAFSGTVISSRWIASPISVSSPPSPILESEPAAYQIQSR